MYPAGCDSISEKLTTCDPAIEPPLLQSAQECLLFSTLLEAFCLPVAARTQLILRSCESKSSKQNTQGQIHVKCIEPIPAPNAFNTLCREGVPNFWRSQILSHDPKYAQVVIESPHPHGLPCWGLQSLVPWTHLAALALFQQPVGVAAHAPGRSMPDLGPRNHRGKYKHGMTWADMGIWLVVQSHPKKILVNQPSQLWKNGGKTNMFKTSSQDMMMTWAYRGM